MLHTKLVSITVATFLMISTLALPTAYASHCKGNHANDPLCPPPPDATEPLAPWSKIISDSAVRFLPVLKDKEGILDRETGLVWEEMPDNAAAFAIPSLQLCHSKTVGGRLGWRLPTTAELSSLVDASQPPPTLPPDHPFLGVLPTFYYTDNSAHGGETFHTVNFNDGTVNFSQGLNNNHRSWCVRGR